METEQELHNRTKVLQQQERKYHWRDAADNPLCNAATPEPFKVVQLKDAKGYLCPRCQDVAAEIAKGW